MLGKMACFGASGRDSEGLISDTTEMDRVRRCGTPGAVETDVVSS